MTRARSRLGHRLGIALAGVVLLVACAPIAAAPPPPPFPGYPGPLEQSTSGEFRHVLTAGDSLMADVFGPSPDDAMFPHLDGVLEGSGRSAEVSNAAVNGFGTAYVLDLIDDAVNDAEAAVGAPVDIVVIQLLGNEEPPYDLEFADGDWLDRTKANALAITNLLLDRGIQVYWAIPPVAAYGCAWGLASAAWNLADLWPGWRAWIRDSLVAEVGRPGVHTVDWQTPFGGVSYIPTFTFPDGAARTVRRSDCTHLTAAGGQVAATATAIAIQHEWTNAPVTTTTEPPTTTTTTTEPPTTTTTTELTTTTTEA